MRGRNGPATAPGSKKLRQTASAASESHTIPDAGLPFGDFFVGIDLSKSPFVNHPCGVLKLRLWLADMTHECLSVRGRTTKDATWRCYSN